MIDETRLQAMIGHARHRMRPLGISRLVSLAVALVFYVVLLCLLHGPGVSAECLHDRILAEHDRHSLFVRAPQDYGSEESVPLQFYHVGEDRVLGRRVATLDAAEPRQLPDGVAPIRIALDTRHVFSDPGRICTAAGQLYMVGNPPDGGQPRCTADLTNHCWGVCAADDVVTEERRRRVVAETLPAAASQLQAALSVRRVRGNLMLLPAASCGAFGGVPIPQQYTTTGVANADIVLFITMRPAGPGVLAWAVQCQEDADARAVAGQVNFNPRTVMASLDADISTAVHEITHVLGFSAAKYSRFVDVNGNTRPLSQVLQSQQRAGAGGLQYEVQVLITPSVASFMQQHYGCDSITGAQLEDGGGAGTALSHWEKRQVFNEFMTGVREPTGSVFSALTLALLADSGWYAVNYSRAEPLLWGKNQGCGFETETCDCALRPGADRSQCAWTPGRYSCSPAANEPLCLFDHSAKAVCTARQYTSALPEHFRFFSAPNIGGSSPLLDFCPVPTAAGNGICADASLNSDGRRGTGETFGPGSRCFINSLVQEGMSVTGPGVRPGCYPVTCIGNSTVQVGIGGQLITCPPDGGTITVPGFRGELECPPAARICTAVNLAVPPDCPLGNCYALASGGGVGGYISGITIGAVAFIVLLIVLCACLAVRRRRRPGVLPPAIPPPMQTAVPVGMVRPQPGTYAGPPPYAAANPWRPAPPMRYSAETGPAVPYGQPPTAAHNPFVAVPAPPPPVAAPPGHRTDGVYAIPMSPR